MRAVIAEDNALLRDGLTRLLTAFDIEVAAAVESAQALVEVVETAEPLPDVVVTDVRMPPTFTTEGLEAALDLRRRHPGLPVLVLSQYVEQLYARELLHGGEGAVGYLLKDRVADVSGFVDAVRRVAQGGTVLDPEVVAQLVSRAAPESPVGRLTPREREVLALMAEGRSNAAIAAELVVTDKAVGKHIGNIFAKLDLPETGDDHRRVRAVIAYLQSR